MTRRTAGSTFPTKQVVSYLILCIFLSYVLIAGVLGNQEVLSEPFEDSGSDSKYGSYVYFNTLKNEQLQFEAPGRRVILVGDIHGMDSSLTELLEKVQYSPSSDVLIHTGDIIAKSTLEGSLAILDFMASNNVTGVRGNHDQEVIEWRGWQNDVMKKRGGKDWLKRLDKARQKKKVLKKLLKKARGWQKIPKDWSVRSDHYEIARKMSKEHYNYLISLPLVLHIPHIHTFVVHAGILPIDPRRSITNSRQPLARVPKVTKDLDLDFLGGDIDPSQVGKNLTVLRAVQERSILSDVPHNGDPWNLLNMKSVGKGGLITTCRKAGVPWAKMWNNIIKRCDGFAHNLEEDGAGEVFGDDTKRKEDLSGDGKRVTLPCYPATVVYGHAASRRLDVKRWTKGLDSGCVYGRRLTALVLSARGPKDAWDDEGGDDEDDEDSDNDEDYEYGDENDEMEGDSINLKFGDKGSRIRARIKRVRCPLPDDS